jgi:hypothetical protein
MMYDYADSLKGHMHAFLAPCFDIMCKIATDRHSSEGRLHASVALTKLFAAAVDAVRIGALPAASAVTAMEACVEKLLVVLKDEVNANSRACAAEALSSILVVCIEAGGPEDANGSIPPSWCKPDVSSCATITADILQRCQESVVRRAEQERAIKRNEGLDDEDREAKAVQLEEEENLLEVYVEILGLMIKLHGPAFMPIFDAVIAPAFAPYLSSKQPTALQILAVCVVDDAIEFGGTIAHKYIPQALSVFLGNVDSPQLKQCSVYGIAVALRANPDACMSSLPAIMAALSKILSAPVTDDDNATLATIDNAAFALGALCLRPEYRGAVAAHLAPMTTMWLQKLPLGEDERQAMTMHRELCDSIERGDSSVMGAGCSNLPEIVRVLSMIVAKETERINTPSVKRISDDDDETDEAIQIAHPATLQRIKSILKTFGSAADPSQQKVIQSAFMSLSPDLQVAFKAAISI